MCPETVPCPAARQSWKSPGPEAAKRRVALQLGDSVRISTGYGRVFVVELVHGVAVHGARRGVDRTGHAGLLRHVGQIRRQGRVVDEILRRANSAIGSLDSPARKTIWSYLAKSCFWQSKRSRRKTLISAADGPKPQKVDNIHLAAVFEKQWNQDRTDITAAARNQNTHVVFLHEEIDSRDKCNRMRQLTPDRLLEFKISGENGGRSQEWPLQHAFPLYPYHPPSPQSGMPRSSPVLQVACLLRVAADARRLSPV